EPADHAAQVEVPGGDVIGAARADLPGRDLELAGKVGGVPGERVVQVVIAHGALARRRVGKGHRNRAELEVDPVGVVAPVVAETVDAEVVVTSTGERLRGIGDEFGHAS